MKIKIITILVSAFIIYSISAQISLANESFLGISPPIIRITANSPALVETKISVRNLSSDNHTFRIEIKPFTAASTQDGKVEYVTAQTGTIPLYKQIEFYDGDNRIESINIDGYKSKDIKMVIPVDPGTPSRDYYFSVAFFKQPVNTLNTNGISLETGVSTNVLLSVGSGAPNLIVNSFSTPFYAGGNMAGFTVLAENTGTQATQAKGKIEIRDLLGNLVETISLEPHYILARTSRYLNNTKTVWESGFMVGLYTANLKITDSANHAQEKRTYFLVIPTTMLVVFIALVIFTSGVFLRVTRKLHSLKKSL